MGVALETNSLPMTLELFPHEPHSESLADGVWLHRGWALADQEQLWTDLQAVVAQAPCRRMVTTRGFEMSVAMSNCGPWGWVSDRRGYRYADRDPESGRPWPEMPASFRRLAAECAQASGFPSFEPDACLINRYAVGSKMGRHQDKDEKSFDFPIVSVSLGLPVVFELGGMAREEKPTLLTLRHGDVLVWGGPARLRYHGVRTLKAGSHPWGEVRWNLTFRRAFLKAPGPSSVPVEPGR